MLNTGIKRGRPGIVGATFAAALVVVAASFAWTGTGSGDRRSLPDSAMQSVGGSANRATAARAREERVISQTLDTAIPDGLGVGVDGHLLVNLALRNVFDYFLLTGRPGGRVAQLSALKQYLQGALVAPAQSEALEIADRYIRYMNAHDALLAQQRPQMGAANGGVQGVDVDHLAEWFSMRARLRQSILGVDIAKAWFGEEERQNEQLIARLRAHPKGADLASKESDKLQIAENNLLQMQLHHSSGDEQRSLLVREFGEAAGVRFDQIQAREGAFRDRVSLYRQGIEAIDREVQGDVVAEQQRIDALRGQIFTGEGERLRARTLVGR